MTIGRPITESRRDGPITVIGATGQQGGAVIDALLKQRIPIRAVTRNPYGTRLVRSLSAGSRWSVKTLRTWIRYGRRLMVRPPLSAMTTHDGPYGPKHEVAHGQVIAAAAADGGVAVPGLQLGRLR